jgi:hypothetical protein
VCSSPEVSEAMVALPQTRLACVTFTRRPSARNKLSVVDVWLTLTPPSYPGLFAGPLVLLWNMEDKSAPWWDGIPIRV